MVSRGNHVHLVGNGKQFEMSTIMTMGLLINRLCGYPPFPLSNDISTLRMIVNGKFEFYENEWKHVSQDAMDFIQAILVPNPSLRANAKTVCILK